MKLSLTTRIFLGYAVVLVTFAGVSGFSVLTLRQNQVEFRLVSEGYLGLSQTVGAIETFQANQAKETLRLRDTAAVAGPQNNETRNLIVLARQAGQYPDLLAELQAGKDTAVRVLDFAPESERPFVEDLAKKFDELKLRFKEREAAAEETFLILESKAQDWEKSKASLTRLEQMENALSSTIRLLRAELGRRIHERWRLTQARAEPTRLAIILLPTIAIVVGLLAIGLTARSLRPVRTLIEGVTRIRRGDYEAKIGVEGQDEIAVLAREFDAMARALKERESQLQQKQQELIRAERLAAVGQISAQVAHEIRNPLSSIGLNVEMLQDQLGSTPLSSSVDAKEARDLLASVMREVDRLTEITEDYLRLARLPTPAKRPESLRRILEEVLEFAREELERSHIGVSVDLPEGALPVSADEGQLRQVFLNLIRNAREAMTPGGTLTLRARPKDGRVEVQVSDTGSGITPEVRAKLFEPFFTTKPGGTGLGLSLSRQIVEAHGGRINVESSPGQGTTFLMELPSA